MSRQVFSGLVFSGQSATVLAIAGLMLLLSTAADAGSCNFIQENMFAGPYDVCAAPVDRVRCDKFGDEGSNTDTVYSDAECATDKALGLCVLEEHTIIYYSGEIQALETGCSFQGGEWKS